MLRQHEDKILAIDLDEDVGLDASDRTRVILDNTIDNFDGYPQVQIAQLQSIGIEKPTLPSVFRSL